MEKWWLCHAAPKGVLADRVSAMRTTSRTLLKIVTG